MNASTFSRRLPAALVLAFAAAALPAQAQNPNFSGPNSGSSPRNTNQAGEAYPNDPKAGTDQGKPAVVQKAENSRPAQATKRAAKKTKAVAKNAGQKTAGAVRNTGQAIERRLPPEPKR